MREYHEARDAENALLAEVGRIGRLRSSAGCRCAFLLADVVAKRVRPSSKSVRIALDEFEGFTAEFDRVSAQLVAASQKRRELAQLNFDAVFKGVP